MNLLLGVWALPILAVTCGYLHHTAGPLPAHVGDPAGRPPGAKVQLRGPPALHSGPIRRSVSPHTKYVNSLSDRYSVTIK